MSEFLRERERVQTLVAAFVPYFFFLAVCLGLRPRIADNTPLPLRFAKRTLGARCPHPTALFICSILLNAFNFIYFHIIYMLYSMFN
jgi:hypothetical protein